jgi:hypothetical protein
MAQPGRGMLEYWRNGIISPERILSLFPFDPILQHSIIPIFLLAIAQVDSKPLK